MERVIGDKRRRAPNDRLVFDTTRVRVLALVSEVGADRAFLSACAADARGTRENHGRHRSTDVHRLLLRRAADFFFEVFILAFFLAPLGTGMT